MPSSKRSIATSMIEFLCNKIITHNFCFHFRRKMQHTSEVLTITQTYMCLLYAFYKRNFLQHNHMLSLSISLLRKYSYSVVLFVLFSLSLSLERERERERERSFLLIFENHNYIVAPAHSRTDCVVF